LRAVFADFDFGFLVAIRLSSGSSTASCAATDPTPPKGRRGEGTVQTGP
jgi:hypothetical protein